MIANAMDGAVPAGGGVRVLALVVRSGSGVWYCSGCAIDQGVMHAFGLDGRAALALLKGA